MNLHPVWNLHCFDTKITTVWQPLEQEVKWMVSTQKAVLGKIAMGNGESCSETKIAIEHSRVCCWNYTLIFINDLEKMDHKLSKFVDKSYGACNVHAKISKSLGWSLSQQMKFHLATCQVLHASKNNLNIFCVVCWWAPSFPFPLRKQQSM